MKCSQLVRIHLIFFQLLGFCPLRVCDFLKKDTLQESVVQKISVGWSYLLVAVLIVQTWIAYRYEHVIFFTVDFFGKFNDLVKFIAISIACYTIQLDSIYRRHQSTIFWENCYELQCTQKSILKDGSKILNIKDFFVKFYGFAVIFFVVEYNVAPVFQHNDSMCNFRLIYLPTLFMARFYFIYYLMYIEIVKTNVKTLNQELELLVTLSNMSINSNNSHHLNNFIAKRLNGAKTFYALLYQMTEWINESFGWAILATFLSSFVELFSNSYWIYWRVYNRFTQYFIEYCFAMGPTLLIVVIILYTSKQCRNEAKKSALTLHKINRNVDDIKLSILILNSPILFIVKGCFELDFTFLRKMTGAITTYMVFFIQFMPTFQSDKQK